MKTRQLEDGSLMLNYGPDLYIISIQRWHLFSKIIETEKNKDKGKCKLALDKQRQKLCMRVVFLETSDPIMSAQNMKEVTATCDEVPLWNYLQYQNHFKIALITSGFHSQ